ASPATQTFFRGSSGFDIFVIQNSIFQSKEQLVSLFSDTQKSNTLLSRTPDLHISDKAEMRRVLRDHFVSTFECYESLFETLANDNAFYEKAISLRHPLIFYYGHTATFFV